ncbi:hypothetical protein LCGC14_0828940 [marine sediment metagenome]|uniref:Uncharacterized protein n=1 Tax=marine sediment metagenome TaxID=412755 RepID=A0A0F9SNZ5_9ZZZZ
MNKISITIECANCVKAKLIPDDWYACSVTGKEWLVIGNTPICKYWRPRVSDVSVWIIRAEGGIKNKH